MSDREKVIGHLNDCMEASRRDNTWVFVRKDIVEDALAMLKEQETQKFFVDESGEITPLPVVVRCKDCKYHGNIYPDYCVNLEQNTNDDFYCADGEKEVKWE